MSSRLRKPSESVLRVAMLVWAAAILVGLAVGAESTKSVQPSQGPLPPAQPAEALLKSFKEKMFSQEPVESLVRQWEGGLPFRIGLAGVSAQQLADRWQAAVAPQADQSDADAAEEVPRQITAVDPATGLLVRQTWRRVGRGVVLVQTSLVHQGKTPIEVHELASLVMRFRLAGLGQKKQFRPLVFRAGDSWYGSAYWTGPDWTRVGKDWHHPGADTPSIRRFTCPDDGQIAITGRVRKAHLDGDGVRVWILHGEKTIWQAELEGKDGQGLEPNLSLQVRRGDRIRFVVHKRGHISCDTTYWDPVITYPDGRRFRASDSFGDKQGVGGWWYEMEALPSDRTGMPTLYLLTEGLLVEPLSPPLGKPVDLSAPAAAPVIVLADCEDGSGLALVALDGKPWQAGAELNEEGFLEIRLGPGQTAGSWKLQPGQSLECGPILAAAYQGPWIQGFACLQRLLETPPEGVSLGPIRERLSRSWQNVFGELQPANAGGPGSAELTGQSTSWLPEVDFWAMIQQDWQQQDQLDGSVRAYKQAAQKHLEKARRLLEAWASTEGRPVHKNSPQQSAHFSGSQADKDHWQAVLGRLGQVLEAADEDPEAARLAYWRLRWAKRQLIFSHPVMQFGKLLFCKRAPTSYSHLVMQYFGWRARPGGGLFILDQPGRSLQCRDILDGRLSTGNVLEPRLSYDGQRIVFSYVELAGKAFDPAKVDNQSDEGFYHIYEVRVDGTGLRQLTFGPYDDLMPNYLPDGGIVFCSTRRRGYARCFGGQFSRRWHVYTLHRMDGDGGNLRTLSWHDTNEWFPTVSSTGEIVYARWDYIDRDAVTHQNLWVCRPDGSNPRALWGNATPSPHCAFQAQPIPGTHKFIFTASPHHSITAGSIAIVDPAVAPDGHAGLVRITPEIPFPEAESGNIREYYASPWPLSENHYLVSYSPKPLLWEPRANDPAALGIYYLDRWGNRELIYRDPLLGSESPCPVRPRPRPPVLESQLRPDAPPIGEMVLVNVYEGLGSSPPRTIKRLRIVQIFPKTTPVVNQPPIGLAGEENARAILGTVPVEPDGSARFLVPAQKPILFQALDEDGFAYQTMRTLTYLQPGEQITCIGCHEHRRTAPPVGAKMPLALRRPPSQIEPGLLGGRPFSYMEMVQPIWDRHCLRCHDGKKPPVQIDLTSQPHQQFSRSYWTLCGDVNFWGGGTNPENAAKALVPRFGARNQLQVTPPGGMYGARGSRLIRLLRSGHEGVRLSAEELAVVAAWIDLNAIFYGVYLPEDQARQLVGEQVPMPEIQ